ncbi:MAG TPA: Lrp/AsnC family transcriptional regulator [Solirubrobacterales bacterium]|nr:Lrp/AsnC family transcriptional regulator [Solirubrobacterales bacterium]
MDQIDHRIVALLRENARRSFQDIGDRVALSAPAVKRRVDRLQRDGVIRGYSANVDPSALGWNTHAFVELYCEGRMSGDEVREAVGDNPEVEGAYTVAGAASAILHLRASDTRHLEQALERIRDAPGVQRTQTQVVLSTLFERPVANGGKPGPGAGARNRAAPGAGATRNPAAPAGRATTRPAGPGAGATRNPAAPGAGATTNPAGADAGADQGAPSRRRGPGIGGGSGAAGGR